MKKFLPILILALLLLTLTACGKKNEGPSIDETEVTATDLNVATTDAQAFFSGDWYGWWLVMDPKGEIEMEDGDWFDCCATIRYTEPGVATMILWDEMTTKEEPLANVVLDISETGKAYSRTGEFLSTPVASNEWYISKDLANYDNMLCFSSTFDDGNASFNYYVEMRPWGCVWDDVEENELPYYYEDWYLPLVNSNGAMPGTIGQ